MCVSNKLLCFVRYGPLRLIDIPHLRTVMPLTMEQVAASVRETSARAAKTLEDDWIQECCQIVDDNRDVIEKWMSSDDMVMSRCLC